MAKRTRKTFLLKSIESLEGRALMSGLSHYLPTHKSHGIHAQVQHTTRVRADKLVPGGPVVTAFTTQAHSGAVNSRIPGLNTGRGNARIKPIAPVTFQAPPMSRDGSRTTTTPLSSLTPTPTQTAITAASINSAAKLVATNSTNAVTTDSINPFPVASTFLPVTGAPTTPVSGAAMAPVPGVFGATLNASEVASFKSAVDTFATNYTSGANSIQDSAAATALNSRLSDVALSIWSRGNIAPKDAVTAFQTASDTFASSYTSGANPSQDAAAWKTLQTAMNGLGNSLSGPNASTTNTVPGAGIYNLASIPSPAMGDMLGLTSNGTISAADVASVKTAVDTFATNYTSGADTTKDQAADAALQTTLSDITMKYWQAMPLNAAGALGMAAKANPATTGSGVA